MNLIKLHSIYLTPDNPKYTSGKYTFKHKSIEESIVYVNPNHIRYIDTYTTCFVPSQEIIDYFSKHDIDPSKAYPSKVFITGKGEDYLLVAEPAKYIYSLIQKK